MNDIDELIERWEKAKKSCGTIGVAALDEAITALQKMQQRIAELEDRNTALTESENYAMAKASRLDAALKEISLGVVAPMDFAKKAREGERRD